MGEQRQNARRSSKRPSLGKNEQKQVEEQDHHASPQPARPMTDDRATWIAYWQAQGQPWRTEPEIGRERQAELEKCRALVPDVEKGIYPFKGMKLERADIEWLLATHDGGPVKRSDEKERVHEGLDVRGVDLQQADLHQLPLTRLHGGLTFDEWLKVTEEQRNSAVVLMRGANLSGAQLAGANLMGAQLKGASLSGAQLERTDLSGVWLERADLRSAILGNQQRIGPKLADVQWGNTNLAVVDWSQVVILGDAYEARRKKTPDGKKKEKAVRLSEYQAAVRANRQLAVALQEQGLNEEAARFAYRAQRLQRIVLRRQKKIGQYFFYIFLETLAGYGYRPIRTVLWYLGILSLFALAYHFFGGLSLYPPDAFVYSLTSFHGRGFFPGLNARPSLHDPLILLAALEAVIGLFIEISFIATFTQRFFGK